MIGPVFSTFFMKHAFVYFLVFLVNHLFLLLCLEQSCYYSKETVDPGTMILADNFVYINRKVILHLCYSYQVGFCHWKLDTIMIENFHVVFL